MLHNPNPTQGFLAIGRERTNEKGEKMNKEVTWRPRDSNLGPLACHAEDHQPVATRVTVGRPTIPWVYMT